MAIFAILITVFLEQKCLLYKVRAWVDKFLREYVAYFAQLTISSKRRLRFIYLFAFVPAICLLIGLKLLFLKFYFISFILDICLFILSVQILTWKEEAKDESLADKRAFINTYATRFFAPLFWFLVLPSAIGSLCYIILIYLSQDFKARKSHLMIYNVVVDKMLFYANIVPYSILFFFIALAGDFEAVTHYVLEQKKHFTNSFYFLENLLNEVVLVAIEKNKFQIAVSNSIDKEIEAPILDNKYFIPEITAYIVAILYRSGLFFIGLVTMISIVKMI